VNAGIVEQGSRRRSTGNRNFRGFGVLAAEGACRELQHQAGGSDRDEGNVESERGYYKRRRYVCLVALKHTAIRQALSAPGVRRCQVSVILRTCFVFQKVAGFQPINFNRCWPVLTNR
jgi:hypothetical protein